MRDNIEKEVLVNWLKELKEEVEMYENTEKNLVEQYERIKIKLKYANKANNQIQVGERNFNELIIEPVEIEEKKLQDELKTLRSKNKLKILSISQLIKTLEEYSK